MAGMKALIGLAFSGSIGMTLLVLGCALHSYNWWPFFVLIFYALVPLPILLSRRHRDDMGTSSACHELAIFITTGIVISAFGLPIVLARSPYSAPTISWGSCGLVLSGNVVVFLTILGFFIAFDNDDMDYSMWWSSQLFFCNFLKKHFRNLRIDKLKLKHSLHGFLLAIYWEMVSLFPPGSAFKLGNSYYHTS